MIEGIKVRELIKNVDERGFFSEIMRDDWEDLLQKDKIDQFNFSYSYPGIVRAWHRHLRGQVDYFIVGLNYLWRIILLKLVAGYTAICSARRHKCHRSGKNVLGATEKRCKRYARGYVLRLR